MDEKNNNLTIKNTSSIEKQRGSPVDLNRSTKKERPIGKNSLFLFLKTLINYFSYCIFKLS